MDRRSDRHVPCIAMATLAAVDSQRGSIGGRSSGPPRDGAACSRAREDGRCIRFAGCCCCSAGVHAAGFCVVSPNCGSLAQLLSTSLLPGAVPAARLAPALRWCSKRQLPYRVLSTAIVLALDAILMLWCF